MGCAFYPWHVVTGCDGSISLPSPRYPRLRRMRGSAKVYAERISSYASLAGFQPS